MSPLEILATSIAYAIMSDEEAATEEKAKMVGILGKHLSNGELTGDELKALSSQAFAYAEREDMVDFLETHTQTLTRGQRFCIMINLFDVVMADGSLKMGEAEVLARFRTAFQIKKEEMKPVQNILKIKNDTAVFVNQDHPGNRPDFEIPLL